MADETRQPNALPSDAEARELVDRALAGDKNVVRCLVDYLTPVIQSRVARALLRRRRVVDRPIRQEVEDLTQGVFMVLFVEGGGALSLWDPARGLSLRNFAGLLAEREVASILRSRVKNPWTEEPTDSELIEDDLPPTPGPESHVESREALLRLMALLREQLSDRALEMFELLIVEARDAAEVCTITGLSTAAVHAWRSRLGRQARSLATEIVSERPVLRRTPLQGKRRACRDTAD